MLPVDLTGWIIQSPLHLEEITEPSTPRSNSLKIYAEDSGGVSTLCFKNDAGTETCFSTAGGIVVTGTGVANRLAYWTGTSTIDDVPRTFTSGSVLFATTDFLPQEDNANFFWDDTNNRLGIGTASPSERIHAHGSGSTKVLAKSTGSGNAASVVADRADTSSYGTLGLFTNAVEKWSVGLRAGGTEHIYFQNEAAGATRAIFFDSGGFRLGTSTTDPGIGVLDVDTGYRIANAATSGNVLRGNGTNFVSAQLALSDLATFSSATLAGRLTDETGSGLAVFNDTPTIITPTIASFVNATHSHQNAAGGGQLDHGLALSGLTDDDHTQYALLAGRSGGQTLIGGTAAADSLLLQATAGVGAGSETIRLHFGSNGADERFRFAVANSQGILRINRVTAGTSALNVYNITDSANMTNFIGDGANANFTATEFIGNANGPTFICVKARGSLSSPGQTLSADNLMAFEARAYDNTPAQTGGTAAFQAIATENITTTGHGTRFSFSTVANGSTTQTARMLIPEDGGIAIQDGITAPATLTGWGKIYIDTADGDLKIKFGDGTVKTIVTDT